MTPDQRHQVLELLRLDEQLPEHELRPEGIALVSGTVRRQRVSYAVPGGRRLSAWMLRPSSGVGPWPGILALHPHGDAFEQGGDEVAGVHGRREHQYGAALAARGFVVLCPDLPGFGQQQAPAGMPGGRAWEELCFLQTLAHGRSLLSETLDQLRCAVAVLLDYESTAGLTVSAMGFGLGARSAAWLAFADRRIDAVWLHAGIGQQQALLDRGRLIPRHILLPGLMALGLDQADIVADLLPRGVGVSFGRQDLVAFPEAVSPVITALRDRAQMFGQVRLEVIEGDYDHRFPAEVVAQIGDRLLAWMG